MSITAQAHKHYEPGIPWEVELPTKSVYFNLVEASRFYGDRPAINFLGTTLNYRQFHALVDQAATVFYRAGVRRGDVVALCLPNCPQHLIAFYALARIGAVAAEHNPLSPAVEIAQQVRRHGGRVAVVWEKTVDAFTGENDLGLDMVFTVDLTHHMPRAKKALMSLPVAKARKMREQMRAEVPASTRSFDEEVARASRIRANVEHARVQDIAVILHTGGTNGIPKSVPLSHLNIGANAAQNLAWAHRLHEGAETFFSLLPYFHSFGLTFFMVCAVKIAAHQVVLPKFDVNLCLQMHRKDPVTFFVGVPAMFSRIAKAAREQKVDITSIRYAISGAMSLPDEVAAQWEEQTKGIIVEGYGMTETSPTMTGSPINASRRHGTLGVPFPSTLMRLGDLDDPDKEPPAGEIGEILVKGPQVFSGYLDAPEETAAAFTSDGYFRTGDIGRVDDGFIILADRRKELILSGGFNVYPSQVEAAIRSMPQVEDVAVVGVPTSDSEDVVAAVVSADPTRPPTLEQVRAWAQKELPHYALPRRLEIIDRLPHSQIGKVMRRAVRERIMKSK
ncbi:MAG: AMP-binding protein [Actinomycetaceae bacterium]|nr:AMP-binding protein [Actinomycetaceae bacterium]